MDLPSERAAKEIGEFEAGLRGEAAPTATPIQEAKRGQEEDRPGRHTQRELPQGQVSPAVESVPDGAGALPSAPVPSGTQAMELPNEPYAPHVPTPQDVGQAFSRASRFVGDRELPPGLVAKLDEPEEAQAVIREVHDYSRRQGQGKQNRRGLVYRLVTPEEAELLRRKFQEVAAEGAKIEAGHNHIIDNSGINHAYREHGQAETEIPRGQMPVTREDFVLVPEITQPENIVEVKRLTQSGELVVIDL